MKVFVTGATGFVGAGLLEELLSKKDFEVSCLVRSMPPKDQVAGWTPVLGDLTDISSFQSELPGHDVIIHCAGRAHVMNDRVKEPLQEFRLINSDSTLRLAEVCASVGVKRFIFLSTVKVNGEETTPGHPFDHTSTPSPVDPYGISKYEAEMQLRSLSADYGLEVCIIRPTLVYGRGVKGNVHRLMQLIEKGTPLPLAAIKNNRRSMVHIDNLVSLIMTCMRHEKANGKTFLVSDDHDMSTYEFIRTLGILNEISVKQVYVPLWILRGVARAFGFKSEMQRLTGNLQVSIKYTKNTLSWTPPRNIGAKQRR